MTCGAMAGSVTPLSSAGPPMPRSRATRKKTLGMFATAALVESTMGKNAAMKIRKIAGGSPMPSQRIANGIHASGDRLLKKLTSGRKAARARAECPSSRPAGTPRTTASRNPGGDAEQRRDRIGHEPSAAQLEPHAAGDVPGVRKERRGKELRRRHRRPHDDEHDRRHEREQGCGRPGSGWSHGSVQGSNGPDLRLVREDLAWLALIRF